MYWSKDWRVFDDANQGVCVYNGRSENIYVNKKAQQIFTVIAPELCIKYRAICRRFVAIVKSRETSLINYSGELKHNQHIIIYHCFSFYMKQNAVAVIVFEYQASVATGEPCQVVFTPREKDILQAIADGKTNKEISKLLGISFETVKSHVRNLLAKTGANSRTELIGKYCR